jgi:hypothetical protein
LKFVWGFKDWGGATLLQGHNTVTMMLVVNNAAQGILSSFFFKVTPLSATRIRE